MGIKLSLSSETQTPPQHSGSVERSRWDQIKEEFFAGMHDGFKELESIKWLLIISNVLSLILIIIVAVVNA